jgi:DNA polymerase-1
VEAAYHKLYLVSDEWVQNRLKQAAKDGYITLAFGLRLRTPRMFQVVMGTSKTPHEAEAEGRTAGNALGQSWCMLNSRAGSEFMGKVRKDPVMRRNIKPCSQIHDAGYFLIKDDMATVLYTNEHLSKAVRWQDDPLIANEHIKMRGELSIFYPNWAHKFDLTNEADVVEVKTKTKKHLQDLKEGKA